MKQIIVKPVRANLTRDTQFIGKMDPYCVCTIGQEKQQTSHINEAGKNPVWNDQLSFFNNNAIKVMRVEVFDKDITTCDPVGAGQIDISPVMFGNGQPRNEIVNIQYEGKPAGQVFLTLSIKFPGQGGCGR